MGHDRDLSVQQDSALEREPHMTPRLAVAAPHPAHLVQHSAEPAHGCWLQVLLLPTRAGQAVGGGARCRRDWLLPVELLASVIGATRPSVRVAVLAGLRCSAAGRVRGGAGDPCGGAGEVPFSRCGGLLAGV